MEFTYDNSYQTSVSMEPYKALYRRPCKLPLCRSELEDHVVIGPQVIKETTEKIRISSRLFKAVRKAMLTYTDGK